NLPDFPSVVLLQPDYGNNLGQYIPGVPAPGGGPNELLAPPGYFPVSLNGNAMSNALTNLYHQFEGKSSVIPKTERYTAYAEGSYEITNNIELYGEFLYNNRKTFTDSFVQIYNFGYAAEAPFVGDPFPGFYNPNGPSCSTDPETDEETCFGILLSPTGIADTFDNKIDVNYYRAVAGVKGKIGSNWTWDAYGQFSHNLGKYTYNQILRDSITSQNFKYGPCAGTFTPVAHKACLDINWVDPNFLAGNLTPEQTDFLFGTETGKTKYDQHYLEASTTGDLFTLPAGPVGVAVGAAWRRDEIDDQPGNITMAPNPSFDPSIPAGDSRCAKKSKPCDEFIDNGYANPVSSGHTFGHSVTTEAFGEVNIPILRNAPFAKSFELSGAARITNVKAVRGSDGFSSSSKGNWTYKVMGNWQVTDWVRLRSTYGTSYRAPALFEQFLANQVSGAFQNDIDPCVNVTDGLANGTITQRQFDNCNADIGIAPHSGAGIQASVFNSGGIGKLKPETSKALTASIILTPRFAALPNTSLALTIDYFDIKVLGEITQLGAKNILYGCYNSLDFPTDPLCALFVRGQEGDPRNVKNVFDQFININRQHNRGLDFTLRVKQGLGGFGSFSLLGNATYQLKDDITLFGGTIDNLNGEIGDPKLVADVNLTLDHKDTSFFWGIDYIGKSSNAKQIIQDNGGLCNTSAGTAAVFGDYCYKVNTKAKFYHSASVTQKVTRRFELTLGVANLFDAKPPRISTPAVQSIGQAPAVSQYDWLGRRFFVAVKTKL
ncbi:TonB-dependent receptor, partial [Sphingomonas sp.]|uniref:TonB-dependent receptor n=1 Tax=Sphingomonas sp. TaxID=28214 RepID=UPI00286CB835